MPEIISLNGEWQLLERPLDQPVDDVGPLCHAPADMPVQVPGDVSDALVRCGRLPEPLVGLNFQQFQFVRERSWWYRRRLTLPADDQDGRRVELSLDGLDIHADIWLDGQHLGHHRSSFHPWRCDITGRLKPGEDHCLLVRLTTGLERAEQHADSDLLPAVPTEADRGYPERGLKTRIWLRKPAFAWGFDWGPPLATCGITGNCYLTTYAETEIRDAQLRTEFDATFGRASIRAVCEIEHDTPVRSTRADVIMTMTDEDGATHTAELLNAGICSGTNFLELKLNLDNPKLWWPNGIGEPHRYAIRIECRVGDALSVWTADYGLRCIELEDKPGRFAFRINGQPVFIQGGNWIPPDSLYGRVTPEKVTTLVAEAATANFNTLRVWGGGRFEQDAFYEACDRHGILVWHDFMSACAFLPGDEAWFARAFEAEAREQVRRLRNRACLMLWCGNNEVSWLYKHFEPRVGRADPGWHLYHHLLPRIVHELSPGTIYRPSSPYGGNMPNAHSEGDNHHWIVMSPDPENWSNCEHWDTDQVPIFNSEYGYGGPCCMTTVRQYIGCDIHEQPDLRGEAARQHTNTFFDQPRVHHSIACHYHDQPDRLSLADYLELGGLSQAVNLGYSLESQRANLHTCGALFWMYNDTWGENGWTIIDYYLRRKVSFYAVRRALSPRKLVLREGGGVFGGEAGQVVLIAINQMPEPALFRCRFGYLSYDGTQTALRPIEATVPPFTSKIVAGCDRPDEAALRCGTVVAWSEDEQICASANWRHRPAKSAYQHRATLRIEQAYREQQKLRVTVSSGQFAHAVHLNLPDDARPDDHYFDLLPGQHRTISVDNANDVKPASLQVQCCNASNQRETV